MIGKREARRRARYLLGAAVGMFDPRCTCDDDCLANAPDEWSDEDRAAVLAVLDQEVDRATRLIEGSRR